MSGLVGNLSEEYRMVSQHYEIECHEDYEEQHDSFLVADQIINKHCAKRQKQPESRHSREKGGKTFGRSVSNTTPHQNQYATDH